MENSINKLSNQLTTRETPLINILNAPMSTVKNYINQIYDEKWRIKLNASTKADTYKIFKYRPKLEKYFELISNTRHLNAMVKLRLSDHHLMIEKGRRCRPPINREEKLSPTCGILGDEIHFLIDCTKFTAQRQEAFRKINNRTPNLETTPNSRQKFAFLLFQENISIIKTTAKCVCEWSTTLNNDTNI